MALTVAAASAQAMGAESTVVDPGALSDHKWLGVKLILGGSAL